MWRSYGKCHFLLSLLSLLPPVISNFYINSPLQPLSHWTFQQCVTLHSVTHWTYVHSVSIVSETLGICPFLWGRQGLWLVSPAPAPSLHVGSHVQPSPSLCRFSWGYFTTPAPKPAPLLFSRGISSHCYTQCGVEARALQADPSWEPVQLRTDCVKLPHLPELDRGFLLPGRRPTEQAGHPTWKHFPPSKYAPPPNVLFPGWQANSFPVCLFPNSRIRQQLFFCCTQHIRNKLKPQFSLKGILKKCIGKHDHYTAPLSSLVRQAKEKGTCHHLVRAYQDKLQCSHLSRESTYE